MKPARRKDKPCSHQRWPPVGQLEATKPCDDVMLSTESGKTSASTQQESARGARKLVQTLYTESIPAKPLPKDAAAGMKYAACAADDHERNGMHRPRNPPVGGDAGCRMPVAVVCRDHARAANGALQALAGAAGGKGKPPKQTKADQLHINRGSSAGRDPARVHEPVVARRRLTPSVVTNRATCGTRFIYSLGLHQRHQDLDHRSHGRGRARRGTPGLRGTV